MYASMVEAAQAPWWSSKPVDDEKSSSSFFPSVNSLFGQAAGRKKDRAPPDSFAKRASDLFALETREERKEKDSDDDVAAPRPRAAPAAPAAEIVLTALPADDGDDASDGPGVEDVRISVGLPDNDSLRTASPPESGSDGGDSEGDGDVMLIHLEDEDDEADRTAGNECWTCPTCTFTNVREAGAGDFGTCSVCESPRPEEADVFVASPRALEFDAPSPAKQRRGAGIFKRSAGADRLAALLSMDIDGGDPSPAENA